MRGTPPPDDDKSTLGDFVFPRDRTERTARRKPRRRKHAFTIEQLRKEIETQLTGAGMLVATIEPFDGQVIATSAGRIADTWTELASKDERVRAAIEGMISGTAWSAAVMALLMPTVLILNHHGIVPNPFTRKSKDNEQPAKSSTGKPSESPNGSTGDSSTSNVHHLRTSDPTADDTADMTDVESIAIPEPVNSPTSGHVNV